MKFFVTGVNGQLGHDVMNELSKRGHEGVGSDLGETYAGVQDGSAVTTMPYVSLDITDQAAVKKQIMEIKPDAVIHCAAWTAVDAAEDEDKQATVKKVNVDGTRNIAEVCKALDCKMLYLSTDYVFDGQGTTPWEPDCKDYKPLNVYGRSKLDGELAVSSILEKYFIVRIAWVFGLNGKNFIKTMINVGKTHDEVRVVCDQIGTPTYTYDLARLLIDIGRLHAQRIQPAQGVRIVAAVEIRHRVQHALRALRRGRVIDIGDVRVLEDRKIPLIIMRHR